MKRMIAIVFLTFIVTVYSLQAQAPAVPAASPNASLYQVVGISEVTVKYARPSVKGRTIYGGLVPYGEVWRTGANTNTTLTLSHEATIGGVEVPAGTYGLFTIPGTSEWTVILSKDNTSWGSGSYKQENDAARFTVKPEKVSNVELLTFNFEHVDSDKARLTIAWADVKIGFDLVFESHKNV
ncbi:MAG TPA: DUF2911 domain-containing protein, partial [Mesotoga sp.]|nr:DUF2911 domain-containing protein [Mesotoga sp.]